MHKVYVYGTLRPGNTETVLVPGTLYDVSWFPGIKLNIECLSVEGVDTVFTTCEILEVDDKRLKELDRYEGYYPSDPLRSLYIRRPYRDGFIYEYNHSVEGLIKIKSGDWLQYKYERERVDYIDEEKEFA